jgi:hypothetical protein
MLSVHVVCSSVCVLFDARCVIIPSEVSTRMVSEYKTKLQISEAENSRLDGTVSPSNHKQFSE